MGLVEDVEAIYANESLTLSERRAAAASAKANGWRAAILGVGVLPQTWDFNAEGNAWSITITSVTVNGGTVTFDGSCRKNGVAITRNPDGTALWPIMLQNPPLLFDDPTGTYTKNGRTLKHDLVALARMIFAQVIANGVP